MVKFIKKSSPFLLALFLGSLWAYSFSTRIGLLFIVPLWLKGIVLLGLGINFGLLAYPLIIGWLQRDPARKPKGWVFLIAILLTSLVFLLAPYRSVPFRTTHNLQITALESEVWLVAALSPDDNLIPREEFQPGDGVEPFDEFGFHLPPGAVVNYTRAQTGGLTLSITADTNEVGLTWDGTSQTLNLQAVQVGSPQTNKHWQSTVDETTGRSLISLPGSTWGDPDPFWTILGILLPIADFITLSSLFVLFFWVVAFAREKNPSLRLERLWAVAWLDALFCLALGLFLTEIGFPDLIPGWFLLFFLPPMAALAYRQIEILQRHAILSLPGFSMFKRLIEKIGTFLKTFNGSQWTFWTLMVIGAIIGAAVQLQLTAPGMGISGDSVHYMEGAKNIAAGNGYVRQIAEGDPVVMTGFPPVYPWALLPGIWLGIGVEPFARFLNTALLMITILLTGWIVYKTTQRALPAFWVTAFLLMAHPILFIYAWVMSEPLFLVLLLASVLLWYRHIQKPTLWKALPVGLVMGILTNTRLAGIALVPVLALGILIYQPSPFMRRLRDAIVMAAAALIQPAAFFIRNSLVAGRVSESRGLTVASFAREYWEIIGAEMSSWFKWKAYFNFSYQQFNAFFVALGVIFLLILGWLLFRKRLSAHHQTDSIIVILLLFIPVYLAVIVFNTILFTPNQTLSGLTRYMIPILLVLLVILGKLFSVYWKQPYLFPKVIILFVVLVGIQLYSLDFFKDLTPKFGFREYTDRKLECGDEVLEIVNQYPDSSFYTNNCEYFFFITGRLCRHLPLDSASYRPDGEVFQAVQDGAKIAYTDGFGTNPPGIWRMFYQLDRFDSSCYMHFYRWPAE